jgi:regulator of sigma E protease
LTANPSFLSTVLSFLLVIGPLIFIHEMGHYLVGRWFGVKAEVFSIGFGREIAGWTDRRGTRWKLAWLPLGGYVKFAGDMNPAGQPSPEWLALPAAERNRTFQAKPVVKRFLIVAAGPVTNLLFAVLVITGFNLALGEPNTPPVIERVERGSAAEQAGLRPGDRIASIDGAVVDRYEDVRPAVIMRPGERLTIGVVRDGRPLTLVASIKPVEARDRFGNHARIGRLGAGPNRVVVESVSLPAAFASACRQIRQVIGGTLQGIGQMLTGKRSVKDLGGPLKIAKYAGEQASLGPLDFLWFVAVISINLGFINLLPIPMLDGGHLFFYAIEAIRRKPLGPQAQEWAFRTGLAALLALMIFVTLNDLASFGLWSKLGGLIG